MSIHYSQNFIENEHLARSLVDSTDVGPRDTVVEIGAGHGTITRALADKARYVIAVEKDAKLARELSGTIGYKSNVQIVNTDFMGYFLPNEDFKVVANIPFNLTAEIMKKLFFEGNSPTSAYLIMQKEAAQIYTGTPRETMKSIFLQIHYNANILRYIKSKEFNPQPKVDAAFAGFTEKFDPVVNDRDLKDFQDLVAFGYVHHAWNKTALQVLKDGRVFTSGQTDYLKRSLGIGNRKINEIDINDWTAIFESFKTQGKPESKDVVHGSLAKLKKEQAVLPKTHRTRRY